MTDQHADVLDFWFRELGPPDWFGEGATLDPVVRARFGEVHRKAVAGELDHWAETPLGRLALIIVLDQFSRHIHRGSAEAFAADAKALQLTLDGLAAQEDEQLALSQRHFFYMPLMHAESAPMQQRSLERFAALKAFAENILHFAQEHSEEIARFGRFPLRNAALDRKSSAEERAWLETAQPR